MSTTQGTSAASLALGATGAVAAAATWWKIFVFGSLEVLGNGASDVGVNFWLRSFQVGAADFTVLLLSAMFYVLLIVPTCVAMWIITHRRFRRAALVASLAPGDAPAALVLLTPPLRAPTLQGECEAAPPLSTPAPVTATQLLASLFCDRRNLLWMTLVTVCDLSINIFGTYAAGNVPVIIQVILKSAEPFLCWLLSCAVWRGAYSQRSLLLIALPTVAMMAAAGGVVAETWLALESATEKSYVGFWVTIFLVRVVSSAAYNVSQGTLMRRNRAAFSPRPILPTAATSASQDDANAVPIMAPPQGDHILLLSTTILAVDATASLIFLIAFGPVIDTITYGNWGSSNTVDAAWANFKSGAGCVFSTHECSNNLWFAILTNGAWVIVYVVDTFLNEISPALNSLMNMLSSPLTTMVLVIFPTLDLGATLHRDSKTILLQGLGIVLMCISVVLFFQYERRKAANLKLRPCTNNAAVRESEGSAYQSRTGSDNSDDAQRRLLTVN